MNILLAIFIFSEKYITFIQSEGAEGGQIAVAVYSPSQENQRYKDGAPIVINIPGGDEKGSLEDPFDMLYDVIKISFLFPGGVDTATGIKSDGTYDHRGENCIKALRDVMKFAKGKLTDVNGKYLHEIISVNPLYNNVGIVGSSNGGNIAIVTLGLYGDELNISWFVGWENPAGEQFVTVDLGSALQENPRYVPYSAKLTENGIVCDIRYEDDLKFDPDAIHPKKHYKGVLYLDLNSNDRFDNSIDYPFGAIEGIFEGEGKWVYSTPVLEKAKEQGLPDPLGTSFASIDEAKEFWKIRDLSKFFDSVVAKLPELKIIMIGTQIDHVQGTIDHPHIVVPYQAWIDKGIQWIRLLPDSAYIAYLANQNIPAKDNDAFENINLYNIQEFLQPEAIHDKYNISASILELCDRVYYNRWEPNLDAPLTGVEETSTPSIFDFTSGINSFSITSFENEKIEIEIFDCTGRKIKLFSTKIHGKSNFSLKELDAGVYFVNIKKEREVIRQKVIVVK